MHISTQDKCQNPNCKNRDCFGYGICPSCYDAQFTRETKELKSYKKTKTIFYTIFFLLIVLVIAGIAKYGFV